MNISVVAAVSSVFDFGMLNLADILSLCRPSLSSGRVENEYLLDDGRLFVVRICDDGFV